MSFFNEADKDFAYTSPENATTGPRVGFLDSFAVAWEEQTRAAAMYGIENQMWKLDAEQARAMRKAGIEHVPVLSPDSMGYLTDNLPGPAANVQRYLDVARYYEDGATPGWENELKDYDKRVTELREQYPQLNLQTSREMWERVQNEARKYEQRAAGDRRTFGGEVGAFIGGAVASMNPNTDPLNFLTLGVGGVGKTALGRIATQAGAQGLIEGVNQITGVQEQRRLLGLDYGFNDAISRVAGAAIGGAAIQGAGEAVGYGLRRWFRSTPTDTAPPPPRDVVEKPPLPDTSSVPPGAIPADETLAAAKLTREPETYIDYVHEASPYSGTRQGRARTVLDLDYVTTRLNEWDGERPWELPPKTDTTVTRARNDFTASIDMTRVVEKSQIDAYARYVDPETFRKYDELAARRETYRRWVNELVGSRDVETQRRVSASDIELQARIDDFDDQILKLALKAEETGGKRAAKLRKDIKALEAAKIETINSLEGAKARMLEERVGKETADLAKVRRALLADDEKMRDLAPLVSRAYARARNKWVNTSADRDAIARMMREGRTELATDPQLDRIARSLEGATPETLADRAPILRQAAKVEGRVARDADAADMATAIVAENAKVLDKALEVYRSQLDGLLSTEKNGKLTLADGRELDLDRDFVFIPNDDEIGAKRMTVRQLLEENKMDEYEIEAVTTCSIR